MGGGFQLVAPENIVMSVGKSDYSGLTCFHCFPLSLSALLVVRFRPLESYLGGLAFFKMCFELIKILVFSTISNAAMFFFFGNFDVTRSLGKQKKVIFDILVRVIWWEQTAGILCSYLCFLLKTLLRHKLFRRRVFLTLAAQGSSIKYPRLINFIFGSNSK